MRISFAPTITLSDAVALTLKIIGNHGSNFMLTTLAMAQCRAISRGIVMKVVLALRPVTVTGILRAAAASLPRVASLALVITLAAHAPAPFAQTVPAPPAVKDMIEYRYVPLDYYFQSSDTATQAALGTATGWVKTGQSYAVYAAPIAATLAPSGGVLAAGTLPIYRYAFPNIAKVGTRWSHFFTLSKAETSVLNSINPSGAVSARQPISEGIDSYAFEPSVSQTGERTCRAGHLPVYRAYRGPARFPDDPNHRFITDKGVYDALVASGWDADGIAMCVPDKSNLKWSLAMAVNPPVPMGVKVYTVNPPAGAVSTNGTVAYCTGLDPDRDFIWVGEGCWYSHVMNGNIRFITAKPAASSSIQRSIVAAVYSTNLPIGSGNFQLGYVVKFHYADDGSFAGVGAGPVGANGKPKESANNNAVTNTQDWLLGSNLGTVTHDAIQGRCFAYSWADNSRSVLSTSCDL